MGEQHQSNSRRHDYKNNSKTRRDMRDMTRAQEHNSNPHLLRRHPWHLFLQFKKLNFELKYSSLLSMNLGLGFQYLDLQRLSFLRALMNNSGLAAFKLSLLTLKTNLKFLAVRVDLSDFVF